MTTKLGDSPMYGATFPGTRGGWQRYCPCESRRGHRRTTIGVSAWGGTGCPGYRQCAGNWSPQTWHTARPPHLATREPPALGDGLSPFSTGKQLREGAEKDGTPAWPRGATPSLSPCYLPPTFFHPAAAPHPSGTRRRDCPLWVPSSGSTCLQGRGQAGEGHGLQTCELEEQSDRTETAKLWSLSSGQEAFREQTPLALAG